MTVIKRAIEKLIADIEAFAQENDLAPATVCGRAVGNNRLYANLKAGAGVSPEVAERFYNYVVEARLAKQKKGVAQIPKHKKGAAA